MFDLSMIDKIKDKEIREGVRAAITKNLLPAHRSKAYPGHFSVTADGGAFGIEYTWPGLDSWQIAGAYLLMDMEQSVKGYFDFVEASQRDDGNIPFAIWKEEDLRSPEDRVTFTSGFRYPDDVFEYTPKGNNHYPTSKWIGLFKHWVYENPLGLLASVCYILTAAELFNKTKDTDWLKEKMPSIERAGKYILSQKSSQGFFGGASFYIELPPRKEWDGITQCYCFKAFNDMRIMLSALNESQKADFWKEQADSLAKTFRRYFWTNGHFAEYIHPEHGAVDFHGLTDIDWAAIAYGLADDIQIRDLWPALKNEKNFWWGDMPTQIVTKPYAYRDWELGRPVSFKTNGPIYDISAMGRVWFIEMNACLAVGDYDRVRQAVKLVCRMGLMHGGYWFERYHMLQNQSVHPAGPKGYCEYPAVLVRTVLGNIELFI